MQRSGEGKPGVPRAGRRGRVISPWDFSLHLTNRSVAPALATGNAVVVKPSPLTPVTGGTLFAKIYEEAGLPPGVLSVVAGAGDEIGKSSLRIPCRG